MKREKRVVLEGEQLDLSRARTLKQATVARGIFKKQTGGMCHFAAVTMAFEPLKNHTADIIIDNPLPPDILPPEFFSGIVQGIERVMQGAGADGASKTAVVGLHIILLDALVHEVDSSEFSFQMGAIYCFREAIEQVGLRPWAKHNATTPVPSGHDRFEAYQARLTAARKNWLAQIEQRLAKQQFEQPQEGVFYRPVNDVWQVIYARSNGKAMPTHTSIIFGVCIPKLAELVEKTPVLDYLDNQRVFLGQRHLIWPAENQRGTFPVWEPIKQDDLDHALSTLIEDMFEHPHWRSSEGIWQHYLNQHQAEKRRWVPLPEMAGILFVNGRQQAAIDFLNQQIEATSARWQRIELARFRAFLEEKAR